MKAAAYQNNEAHKGLHQSLKCAGSEAAFCSTTAGTGNQNILIIISEPLINNLTLREKILGNETNFEITRDTCSSRRLCLFGEYHEAA